MKQVKKQVGKRGQVVFVINGKAGTGKDTLINFAMQYFTVRNISSVLMVKDLCMQAGWDGVYDVRGRQLLVDIKEALVKYDDLPLKFLLAEHAKFRAVEQDVMFVHIREAKEIAKFKKAVPEAKTLLIKRGEDDGCLDTSEAQIDYKYDFVIDNNVVLEKSGGELVRIIEELRKR